MDKRALGVEYFVKTMSMGERTAAERLQDYLAPDVELDVPTQPGQPVGRVELRGPDAVLEQISGQWPSTPGYTRAGWSEP